MSDETPEFGGFGVGSRLAGYRLDEQIGRGGMAVVYRAYDIRLERPVAIKVLSPELARDEAFRQRFIRESRTAAAVDHPNIIPIFEAGEANGVLFIAMRFVHGLRTCGARGHRGAAARRPGLPHHHPGRGRPGGGSFARAGAPGRQAGQHAARYGGRGRLPGHAYLSDFGLSKRALSVSALTSTGQFLGTLDYVAPEQIEARAVTGRADEYALACSAFTMLTGHPPFVRDESVAVMWAQISAPPPALTSRRPDLPAAVDEVMAKALAKVPTERYGTCPEFAAALRRACGLESGPGLVPGPAADFPDVPLRESTQVVPAVPAEPEEPGAEGPMPRSGSGTGRPDRPAGTGQPGPVPAGAAAADSGPAAGDPGPASVRPPGPARGESGPATELSGPARSGPEAEPASPGSRRLDGTDPGPLRPDLPRRRPRCHPTRRGMSRGHSGWLCPPGRPARRRPSAAGPAPGRPEPPRRRRGLWAVAALAVVVVLAAVGYFVKNSFSTGAKTAGSAQAVSLKPPGCTTQTAKGTQLKHVGSHMVATGGNPFDVATVPGFAFVSGAGSGLAVMNTSKPVPSVMWGSPLNHAQGEALTPDGRYLVVTGGSGITVFRVSSLEQGGGRPGGVAGQPGPEARGRRRGHPRRAVRVRHLPGQRHVGVFNLQRALTSGFGSRRSSGSSRWVPSPSGSRWPRTGSTPTWPAARTMPPPRGRAC